MKRLLRSFTPSGAAGNGAARRTASSAALSKRREPDDEAMPDFKSAPLFETTNHTFATPLSLRRREADG